MIAGGGYSPYSKAERTALTEDLLTSGMNRTYLADYFHDDPDREELRSYWRFLSNQGVRFAYGWNNGMNWPFRLTDKDYYWRRWSENRAARGRLYNGDMTKFKDSIGIPFDAYIKGKSELGIFCQEYMATNEEHYQELLKKFRDIRKVFPGVYLLIWDWEYNTPGNSCFCPTCKEAFSKFADVADAAQLSEGTGNEISAAVEEVPHGSVNPPRHARHQALPQDWRGDNRLSRAFREK